MSKPTIKQVAEAADVSITTVSLVLSKKGRISDEVRKRVLAAAKATGYSKKRFQAGVQARRSIGILINIEDKWSMVWHFIRPILEEIDQYFSKKGYQTVLIPILDTLSEEEMLKRIVEQQCVGVFPLHYGNETIMTYLEEQHIPVVVIMNGQFQESFFCVIADDFQGAYEGAKHLLRLGHSNTVFVETKRGDLKNLSTDRFYGFKKAVDEWGIKFQKDHHVRCDVQNSAQLESYLKPLFVSASPPTAVFALDDDVALRVVAFLSTIGLRVPQDVSIISPGDLFDFHNPFITPITTLKIHTRSMGKMAAELMYRRLTLEHIKTEHRVIKIKEQLIDRGSTRAIAPLRSNHTIYPDSHRYRFLCAFTHTDYPSVPRWLGASREFIAKACNSLAIDEEQFHQKIGDDLRWLELHPIGQSALQTDIFGIIRRGEGYGQATTHPLQQRPTLKALHEFPWPDPEAIEIDSIRHRLHEIGDDYALAGGSWSPFWHDAIDLVSLETLAFQMYDHPEFVSTLLQKIVDYYIALCTRIFEEANNRIDLFFLRNDFGTQLGPLISPDHFKQFIVPCLSRFTQLAHRYNIKVMLHSSGGILPLIPSIINSGVDALHALQPDCPGMQSRSLKKLYGNKLVLSGAIDARNVLMRATPTQVQERVYETLRIMSEQGGYIAAPSVDAITEDTPVENILAMYEAIDQFSP